MLFLLCGASGQHKSLHCLDGFERHMLIAQGLPNTFWTQRRAQSLPEGADGQWQTSSEEMEQMRQRKKACECWKVCGLPQYILRSWKKCGKHWFSCHYLFFISSVSFRSVIQGLTSFVSNIHSFNAHFAEERLLLLASSSFSPQNQDTAPRSLKTQAYLTPLGSNRLNQI